VCRSSRRQALKQFEKLKRGPSWAGSWATRWAWTSSGIEPSASIILEEEKEVEIWGIGKREAGRIYRMVGERIPKRE